MRLRSGKILYKFNVHAKEFKPVAFNVEAKEFKPNAAFNVEAKFKPNAPKVKAKKFKPNTPNVGTKEFTPTASLNVAKVQKEFKPVIAFNDTEFKPFACNDITSEDIYINKKTGQQIYIFANVKNKEKMADIFKN